MKILSPITLREDVEKVLDIKTQDIIDLYKKDYDISVDSYFRDCDSISIYRCLNTDLMFYHPVIVGDGLFYEQLQKLGWYYPSWKWENELVSSYVQSGASLLEIGCGDGHFLHKMRVDKNTYSVGIELNEKAAQNVNNKGIEVITDTIENYSKMTNKKFDVVCCFQVLEHVPNIHEFIESCISLLNSGGTLAFAVPNNTPYLYGYDIFHTLNLPPHHQSLWNKNSFSKLSSIFPELELIDVKSEPIDIGQFQAYMLHYKKFFEKEKLSYFLIKKVLPKFFWVRAARLIGVEGRNIVAIYKKKSVSGKK
jgi:2-polyprenyl-3-methyl-5-hydroxy-6-metoxy-1,4-benzoquinol methylase